MNGKKRYFEIAFLVFLPFIALICLINVSLKSNQSILPLPMPQSFIGEYSYDAENWLPLTDDAELSALDGDLNLRGHFERNIVPHQMLCYYRNHIGVSFFVNGERLYIDTISEIADLDIRKQLFSSMCGQGWASFGNREISTDDYIEITLHNPHISGNESAYRDFLSTLCCDVFGANLLSSNLEKYGEPFRTVGGFYIIAALAILGASIAAVIVNVPIGGRLLKQGLLVMFAGGFIMLDTIDASFRNELVVLHTYSKHICMMLAAFFMGHFACEFLTGQNRTVARIALFISSILNSVLILLSLFGLTVIYDTLPYWAVSQLILCPLLAVCCAMELRNNKEKKRLIPLSVILMFVCIVLDIFGVGDTLVWRSPFSKLMSLVLFIIYIVNSACAIVANYRASIRAAKLETELEDSRISIMLSQIQPHFLYNVLGTIRGLCREDPMQARQSLGDFSDYLRSNISALANSNTIHFTSELRHIEAYLRLEKIRMGENLNIIYDIQEKNFLIPPLTIQPLVENAIKHGLFENGGGTVTLHTERQGDRVVIRVHDDGVGFDVNAPIPYDEHHTHVGLTNVRSRLEKISEGTLIIDSVPGAGTTATVFLKVVTDKNGG